jgi:hypothetical protein
MWQPYLVLFKFCKEKTTMCDSSIVKARKSLTKRLTRERWIIVGPACAVCGNAIIDTAEVQAVLVSWEMAHTWAEEEALLVYSPANCVLVHQDECHYRAGTVQGKEKCVAHLLTWQGFTHIEAWLDQLKQPERLWIHELKKNIRGVMRRMAVISPLTETRKNGRIAFD